MSKIRVLIADDHAVMRAGLRMLLNAQSDMIVVGEVGTHYDALAKCKELDPDVLTLDLSMPGGPATRTLERLRAECPRTRILILTMHDEPSYLRVALTAGAAGYVVKTAADTELLTAIRAVASGRIFLDVHFSQESMGILLSGTSAPNDDPLSPREREVLALLARGFTNLEAGERLKVSDKTIATYRKRIGEKLGLQSRADLVRYAMEKNILAPDEPDQSLEQR